LTVVNPAGQVGANVSELQVAISALNSPLRKLLSNGGGIAAKARMPPYIKHDIDEEIS
jgi:hypothetical protein